MIKKLNEGLFSPNVEDKATNSNFTLGSLIMDNHNTLQKPKNRREADIRYFIKRGEFPEREEEKEDNEEHTIDPGSIPRNLDYIDRKNIVKENSIMDKYTDHLLVLDEARMGKVPGTSLVHHAVNGNAVMKNMLGGAGAYSKTASDLNKMALGKKGYEAQKKQSMLGMKYHKILSNDENKAAGNAMNTIKDTAKAITSHPKYASKMADLKNMARAISASAEIDPRLTLFEQNSTEHGTQNDGVDMGVGLGKPHDDGNHLMDIKVNDYQASDANFVGDGEEAETSKTNIPAILAAKLSGGEPDPKTVDNAINKRFTLNPGPSLQEGMLKKLK